jgi:hypothetical protein
VSNENPDRDGKESGGLSKREIVVHAGASTDAKTQRLTPVPAPEAPLITEKKSLEPTRRFAASSEAQTALQNASDIEPTKTFSKDETEREADEPKDIPDENALRPGRVRFVLVCLLFVNMFVVAGRYKCCSIIHRAAQRLQRTRHEAGFFVRLCGRAAEGYR